MGHMSYATLKAHGPSAVKGMDFGSSTMDIPTICHGCELGKSTCKPFPGSTKTTSRILEIVHSDLAGPMQTKSIQGSSFIATFVNDHSRHTVIYFLKTKNQFAAALQKFLSWAETQTSDKLHALHSDRGGKYMAANVKDILSQRGIEHHLMMLGSPQQNGKAERFNRTIMDKVMAMLHTAGLLNSFWEYAVSTAAHTYNRTPSHKWQTPIEAWKPSQVPDVSYFCVFRCKGYMHVPTDKQHKLDAKAIEVTLVGYKPGSKGYQLWDKHTHSVKLSRDVTFNESCFPSQQGAETHPQPTSPIPIPFFLAAAAPNPAAEPPSLRAPSLAPSTSSEEDVINMLDPDSQPNTPPIQGPAPPTTPEQNHSLPNSPPNRPSVVCTVHHPPEPEPEMPGGFEDRMQRAQLLCEMDTAPRHSGHTRVLNPRYYNANNAMLPPRQHNAVNVLDVATAPAASAPLAAYGTPIASQASPLQATDVAPIARTAAATMAASAVHTAPTDEVRQLALAELLAAAAPAAIGRDPVSYKEAMEATDAEEWAEACQYKMDALSKNDTWELVNLPPGHKAIKSKWVFKLKADGRFCACLVAKGFMQIPGIDYDETFSPVARFESL